MEEGFAFSSHVCGKCVRAEEALRCTIHRLDSFLGIHNLAAGGTSLTRVWVSLISLGRRAVVTGSPIIPLRGDFKSKFFCRADQTSCPLRLGRWPASPFHRKSMSSTQWRRSLLPISHCRCELYEAQRENLVSISGALEKAHCLRCCPSASLHSYFPAVLIKKKLLPN